MHEDKKEKDKQEWVKKKEPIIGNIDESIVLKEKALKNTSEARADINQSVGQLKNDLIRLYQLRDIYKSSAYLPINPVTKSSIDSMYNLSVSEKESATNVFIRSQEVKTDTYLLAGTVSISSAVVASMSSNTFFMTKAMVDITPIEPTIEKINYPTPNDRKNDLVSKLKQVKLGLATKLEGAWQTLNDETHNDRFSQSANSARELISDLLITLASEEKVQSTKWFKPERDNGEPTQRQRAKYVILGMNDALSDEILKPIDELSKNIRDSYEKLNPIAHQRDYNSNLQALTESLIDAVQIYLLELLKLRNLYFKE